MRRTGGLILGHKVRWVFAAFMIVPLGCLTQDRGSYDSSSERLVLQRRAEQCLHAAIRYPHNAVVRVEAVEALESVQGESNLPWLRSALSDQHPAVRFAACVAIGRLHDKVAEPNVRHLLSDPDSSVQAAAFFALHRLGDPQQSGRITGYLLEHKEVTVRRNGALLLGLLGEFSAVPVLARAMSDRDPGVRQHALEAMARLDNREARQELVFMTNAGVGSDETFAVLALAETGDPTFLDTFRYRLANAPHLETRLAAARALGKLGSQDGLAVAMRTLESEPPTIPDPNDPEPGQQLRLRQMAAAALGGIGRTEALPALATLLDASDDPRIQVSAARAILEILKAEETRATRFLPSPPRRVS